jgi:hypothetical protein
LTPNFPEFFPESAKKLEILRPRLAEIETTVEWWDLIRIHIGRGKTDRNQAAYLASRPDGFGTMSFRGSPLEFEVLYDDQAASFADAPIGGAVFDSLIDFTPEQKTKSGWADRFSYICEWFSPRLKQVKGGDLFVDISYLTPYKKELRFYWANDITTKTGKFYSIPQNLLPFKKIVLENPTVPPAAGATALPEEEYSLRAKEDEQVEWNATYKGNVFHGGDQGGPPSNQEFTFTLAEVGSAPLYSDKITISYPSDPNTRERWKIEHSQNGNALTTEYLFGKDGIGNYATPLGGRLTPYRALFRDSTNQTRQIDYEWPADLYVAWFPPVDDLFRSCGLGRKWN